LAIFDEFGCSSDKYRATEDVDEYETLFEMFARMRNEILLFRTTPFIS
jgi:hypothetical protein